MKRWLSLIVSALTVPMMFGGCAAPADNRLSLDGKTLVVFGDSLTAQSTWPMDVAETLNMHLINRGIGANTTDHGAERFERDVVASDPDFVLMCFGSNDFYRKNGIAPQVSLDDYRQNLQHFVERVREIGAEPILMTPPFISESASGGASNYPEKSVNKALDHYVEAMREVAKDHDGSLELDSEPADISDGFILKYGDIEENCTFDAIFDAKRDELRDLVNKNLFDK